jgi:hypothetical protein
VIIVSSLLHATTLAGKSARSKCDLPIITPAAGLKHWNFLIKMGFLLEFTKIE